MNGVEEHEEYIVHVDHAKMITDIGQELVRCKDCVKKGKPLECPIDKGIANGYLNEEDYDLNFHCGDGIKKE